MKSRTILIIFSVGLFGPFLLATALFRTPESGAVVQAAPAWRAISATNGITMYLPILLRTPEVLYVDDFSDPGSGWPIDDTGDAFTHYRDGEYEIEIVRTSWWGGAAPPLGDISNYSVEADMRLHAGSNPIYGLVFDRVDWDHFYLLFVIPESQLFGILRHDPAWVFLVPSTSSTAINTGNEPNHLKVERNGDQIFAYANGQLLGSVSDNTYNSTSGEVGLFAQTLDVAPMKVRFDNFLVMALPGTSPGITSATEFEFIELTGEGSPGIELEPNSAD